MNNFEYADDDDSTITRNGWQARAAQEPSPPKPLQCPTCGSHNPTERCCISENCGETHDPQTSFSMTHPKIICTHSYHDRCPEMRHHAHEPPFADEKCPIDGSPPDAETGQCVVGHYPDVTTAPTQRRIEELETVLRKLVSKLDVLHADSQYKAVWTLYHAHGGRYSGPTYTEELASARAALGKGKVTP